MLLETEGLRRLEDFKRRNETSKKELRLNLTFNHGKTDVFVLQVSEKFLEFLGFSVIKAVNSLAILVADF